MNTQSKRSAFTTGLAVACAVAALLGVPPAAADETIWDIQLGLYPEQTLVEVDSVVVTAVGFWGYFVQEPNPHPNWGRQYSGIWVFTNSNHTFHKGDFVTVRGIYKEYFMASEIDVPAAGAQGMQLLLGTAPIPDPVEVTIAEVGDTGLYAEAYESVFIRVDREDPSLWASEVINQFDEWYVRTESPTTGDSLLVYHESAKAGDDFDYENPDPGTELTHIQGIHYYKYNRFRLAPRSCEEDIGGPCKPTVRGAYSTGPSTVRVQFSVNVDEASAGNPGNYELASGFGVLSAQRDAENHKLVHLTTEVLPNGDPEQLIVNNIESEEGVLMDPNQTFNFRSGITSIYQIQHVTNPAVNDASPLVNEVVTVQGRVTAVEGNYYYLQDAAGGAWNGLYCRVARTGVLKIGDLVQVSGQITEYFGLTEMSYQAGVDNFQNLGPAPDPVVTTTVVTPQIPYRGPFKTAEPYETCLIKLNNATILDSIPGVPGPYYGEWQLKQASYPDTAGMDMAGLYQTSYDACPGNIINLTGILLYSFSQYRIAPRTGRGGDIIEVYAIPGCPVTSVDEGIADTDLLLRPNVPNPFGPNTTLAFQLERPAQIQFEVMDVAGRLVRVLSSGRLEAGEHRFVWDGRNESGHRVAAGTYFCRLRADGQNVSRKMVRIE